MISWPPPLPHGFEWNCISRAECAQNVQTERSIFLPPLSLHHARRRVCARTRASRASVDLCCFYCNSRVGMKVSAGRAMELEQPRAPHALLSVLA